MSDFKQQMQRYGRSLGEQRCPLSEAELDRAVRHAVWNGRRSVKSEKRKDVRVWKYVAAACMAALLVPAGLLLRPAEGDIGTVSIDGQQVVFACNRGCGVEGTVDMLGNMVKGGLR